MQAHKPWPQSMVPPLHSSVQATPSQLGIWLLRVQLVEWQHLDGTQSLSKEHLKLDFCVHLLFSQIIERCPAIPVQKSGHCFDVST